MYLFLLFDYTILKIDLITYNKYVLPIFGISSARKMYLLIANEKHILFKFLTCISIFSLISVSIYSSASRVSYNIIKNRNIIREVIYLNNGMTYTTNDSILYIGETNSTIFLYIKQNNNTIIINRENVIQTELINQATIK